MSILRFAELKRLFKTRPASCNMQVSGLPSYGAQASRLHSRIPKLNAVTYPTVGSVAHVAGLPKAPQNTLAVPDFAGMEYLAQYGYYKILAEGKPLFNNEMYARASAFNAIWLDAIHHSGGSLLFAWDSGAGHQVGIHPFRLVGMSVKEK